MVSVIQSGISEETGHRTVDALMFGATVQSLLLGFLLQGSDAYFQGSSASYAAALSPANSAARSASR